MSWHVSARRVNKKADAEKAKPQLYEPPEKFVRLMHATFHLVGEAMGWPTRNVRGWLALMTGHYDSVVWPPGHHMEAMVPHSMAHMHRAELEAFWEDACDVIRKDVLPHIHPIQAQEIRRRINDVRQNY
ncbi:MAG: hypothetical protein C5B54_04760 [Acidobacteria bacterium]|nr:MAG: hypothetical protein C5B54_04760 [Acidobacteriota bacterium]